MIFRPTTIEGAFVVELERREDERGFFARSWCRGELEAQHLDTRLAQCSISWNRQRGTLRGMHWQAAPHEETKLVRCTRGALWDVALDLRPNSPSYLRHAAVELNADNRLALYIPAGCAHGFQTLSDDTEILYFMSTAYAPEAQRGARWDDPSFGIGWPIANPIMHPRDQMYPDFVPERAA
jgi:dTDP-4-dehydrorhamnose 3,5-epimerase